MQASGKFYWLYYKLKPISITPAKIKTLKADNENIKLIVWITSK